MPISHSAFYDLPAGERLLELELELDLMRLIEEAFLEHFPVSLNRGNAPGY